MSMGQLVILIGLRYPSYMTILLDDIVDMCALKLLYYNCNKITHLFIRSKKLKNLLFEGFYSAKKNLATPIKF